MADCECLSTCPFFNDRMDGMDDMVEIVKNRLCRGDNESCARYQVFKVLGGGNVPADLYPTQMSHVADILKKAQEK